MTLQKPAVIPLSHRLPLSPSIFMVIMIPCIHEERDGEIFLASQVVDFSSLTFTRNLRHHITSYLAEKERARVAAL
jgi:hypothetical protein